MTAATHTLSPRLARAITDYVVKHSPCTFEQIFEVFGVQPDNYGNRQQLHKRLAQITDRGDLSTEGFRATRVWVAPGQRVARTTPPQHNIFTAPLYVPPRMGTDRLGALDFERCASHGTRC